MKLIKLIWDFRGPNAQPIAEHHAIHLKEFAIAEALENSICDTEKITEMHFIAFLVVEREKMDELRKRLKPTRGQEFQQR